MKQCVPGALAVAITTAVYWLQGKTILSANEWNDILFDRFMKGQEPTPEEANIIDAANNAYNRYFGFTHQ